MIGERIGLTPGCRAFQLKQCPARPSGQDAVAGTLIRLGIPVILRVRVQIMFYFCIFIRHLFLTIAFQDNCTSTVYLRVYSCYVCISSQLQILCSTNFGSSANTFDNSTTITCRIVLDKLKFLRKNAKLLNTFYPHR